MLTAKFSVCVDAVDQRADGEPAEGTDYATCQKCGKQLRYGYVLVRSDAIADRSAPNDDFGNDRR